MNVKVIFLDEKYRLINIFTNTIAIKRDGSAWDNGGFLNATLAIQEASLINSGSKKDTTSPIGPSGQDGQDGQSGQDGIGFVWRGPYSNIASYDANDVVSYSGSSYICKSSRTIIGIPPNSVDYWDLMARAGYDGISTTSVGATGPKGEGVPIGGTSGQVLAKATDTDLDTEWVDATSGSVESFVFIQSTPSNEWTINHNLGIKPDITILTTGGSEVIAEVVHISTNQAKVYFAAAMAGTARCI